MSQEIATQSLGTLHIDSSYYTQCQASEKKDKYPSTVYEIGPHWKDKHDIKHCTFMEW